MEETTTMNETTLDYHLLVELEKVIFLQESYFDNIIEMGLLLENSGQYQRAVDVYKRGIEKAEKAKSDILGTMQGLVD